MSETSGSLHGVLYAFHNSSCTNIIDIIPHIPVEHGVCVCVYSQGFAYCCAYQNCCVDTGTVVARGSLGEMFLAR